MKKQPKDVRILSIVFGLLGLGLVGAGLVIFLVSNFLSSGNVGVAGKVVDLTVRRNSQAPIIEYVVNGKSYQHTSPIYSSLDLYKVGDAVMISYDPNAPQNSYIDSYRVEWLVAGIIGTVGIGFGVAAGILRLLMLRRDTKLVR